ncbi:unnamed protein product [Caretta caretta]
MQELPDLSHLTEEERNIIMAVMDRQKEEEEKEEAMLKRLHQQFESYKEQVRKIGEEARRYQGEHKDDAPTFVHDVEVVFLYDQTMRTKWLCGYVIYVESNKKS